MVTMAKQYRAPPSTGCTELCESPDLLIVICDAEDSTLEQRGKTMSSVFFLPAWSASTSWHTVQLMQQAASTNSTQSFNYWIFNTRYRLKIIFLHFPQLYFRIYI